MAKAVTAIRSDLSLNVVGDRGVVDPKDGSPFVTWHLPDHERNPTKEIKFSCNWNGKCNCRVFTTIRLHNEWYRVGEVFWVIVKGERSIRGRILEKRVITLDQLPSFTAYQDTGYSLEKTKALLHQFYDHKVKDWATQKLDILLIENIEW